MHLEADLDAPSGPTQALKPGRTQRFRSTHTCATVFSGWEESSGKSRINTLLRFFFYGTLMDAEFRTLVLGDKDGDLPVEPASHCFGRNIVPIVSADA